MTIENNQFWASQNFWVSLFIGLVTAMFLIAVAPNFFRLFIPHQADGLLPKTIKELIARYVYGAGAILLGGGLAVTLMGYFWVALAFFIVATGCGFVVVLRYFAVDHASAKLQNSMQRKNDPDLL